MTLSTLQNKQGIRRYYLHKYVIPYTIVTIICVTVSFIYSQFSHGVSSPHMTYLFAYPLILGVDVGFLAMIFARCKPQSFLASHFYHTAVAALILSSILRGVFEIAGTSSIYEDILFIIGVGLIMGSIICYAMNRINKNC